VQVQELRIRKLQTWVFHEEQSQRNFGWGRGPRTGDPRSWHFNCPAKEAQGCAFLVMASPGSPEPPGLRPRELEEEVRREPPGLRRAPES